MRVERGGGTIGTDVTANVASTGTLELAGAYSALGSTTPANRAAISNLSTATAGVLVSSGNQQVGGIDGAGNVQVTPPTGQSDSLTADHITAGGLVIGGDATSSAVVTIAASNPDGTPMASSSGFALADSLASSTSFALGTLSSSNLLAAAGSSSDGVSLGDLRSAASISAAAWRPSPGSFGDAALGAGQLDLRAARFAEATEEIAAIEFTCRGGVCRGRRRDKSLRRPASTPAGGVVFDR